MLPYSTDDLDRAEHVNELPERSIATHVNVDHEMMALAGDDSWSATVHREFLVYPRRFEYQVLLRPFDSTAEKPGDLYKSWIHGLPP